MKGDSTLALEYDIAIIGLGAAAFSASIKASEISENKARIAMIGTGPLGGTCVNVGCVPSKYLIEASNSYFYSKKGRFPGINSNGSKLDFGLLMKGLRDLVTRMRNEKYAKVLKSYPNVEPIEGKARFVSSKEIEVYNGNVKKIKAEKIIVAVGSRPSVPNIDGINDVDHLTSDTIWSLDSLPDSIVIVGGGAIGLEIGQALQHLGSEVTIIEATPRIVPTAEPEISELLKEYLEEEGMRIITKARIASVSNKQHKINTQIITSSGKKEIESEKILVATGRAPNTDQLRLDKAGVKTDAKGFIITDETMKTSNSSIYAAGDCVPKKLMLETLAAREGVVAASNIMGIKETIDYSSTPWAVFTWPQIASVGYNEQEFMKLNGSCSCRVLSIENVPKADIIGEKTGLAKIVVNPSNGKVVGVHVLSAFATEFIIEGAYAIKYGMNYEDIIRTTHVFPTVAESIKLASQSFIRDVSMMSCCVE